MYTRAIAQVLLPEPRSRRRLRSASIATAARCTATSRRHGQSHRRAVRSRHDGVRRRDSTSGNTKHEHDYSYSLTGQLAEAVLEQLRRQVAYTYGHSYDVWDLTSSVAYSNWQFGRSYAGRQDAQELRPSKWDAPHRFVVIGHVLAARRRPTSRSSSSASRAFRSSTSTAAT